jgi:hypothetical protein
MQCPRLSYYLFSLLFLTKQNGNERKSFLLLPFCLYVVAPCAYRRSTVWDRVQIRRLCAPTGSAEVSRRVTSSFDYQVDIKGSTIPRIEPITVIVSALFLVCA